MQLQSPIASPYSSIAPPPASMVKLAEVLMRSDIWRGDALAATPRAGVPTGFAELDAALPGGGWPRGAVVELMSRRSGIGELALLMPALTTRFAGRSTANTIANTDAIVCVAPPLLPFAPGWVTVGLQRLMVIRAQGENAAWACARVLDTEGVGALLAWLPDSRAATMRRLQLLAERSEALVFAFRPCACVTQSSPAPLRLVLETSVSINGGVSPAPTDATLVVHLLKRRGAGCTAPLLLNLPRPRREVYGWPAPRTSSQLRPVNSDVVVEPAISSIPA